MLVWAAMYKTAKLVPQPISVQLAMEDSMSQAVLVQLVLIPTVTHAQLRTNVQLVPVATQFSIMLVLPVMWEIAKLAQPLINAKLV